MLITHRPEGLDTVDQSLAIAAGDASIPPGSVILQAYPPNRIPERDDALSPWARLGYAAPRFARGEQGGGAWMLATEWSFGNVLWTMLVFFFWFMAIWIFIMVFSDIFRRRICRGRRRQDGSS